MRIENIDLKSLDEKITKLLIEFLYSEKFGHPTVNMPQIRHEEIKLSAHEYYLCPPMSLTAKIDPKRIEFRIKTDTLRYAILNIIKEELGGRR